MTIQSRAPSTIRRGCLTGQGAIRNGFYGGSRYVYESAAIIAEERARIANRAAAVRAIFGQGSCPVNDCHAPSNTRAAALAALLA